MIAHNLRNIISGATQQHTTRYLALINPSLRRHVGVYLERSPGICEFGATPQHTTGTAIPKLEAMNKLNQLNRAYPPEICWRIVAKANGALRVRINTLTHNRHGCFERVHINRMGNACVPVWPLIIVSSCPLAPGAICALLATRASCCRLRAMPAQFLTCPEQARRCMHPLNN